MSMKKGFLAVSIAFFLLLSIAHAAPFDVSVTAVKDKIVVDEVAEFTIEVRNNLDTREEFTIKKAGYPFWDMYTKPLQNPITLIVPAHGSSSLTLYVDPLYITNVDTYTLDLGVEMQRTAIEQKVPLTIGIKSTEPLIGGYIPTVLASISITPEEADPRDDIIIKVMLNNQNVLDYPNLTIKIDGNLIKDELHVPLGPKEEKTIEVAKKLDDMALPQNDQLVVAVFKDGRLIVNPIVKEFSVKEYQIRQELPAEESFLKVKRGIKVVSNNPDFESTLEVPTTALKNLFISTEPRAEFVRESGRHYIKWEFSIGSDREEVFYVKENYRPIVVIAALAAIAVALYFMLRSPMVVKKGIVNVGMSEGGISQAKVVIKVKNRSSGQLADIEVVDNLPYIAHVEKDISIGSMQPHAVLKHPKHGMIIKWSIEKLEPGDERVLSYKMVSRLPILGEFNLPSATARCKSGNKVVLSNSNRVTVGG